MRVYVIPGNPVSLKRPRYSSATQRMYNSQRNQMLVMSIGLQSQHNNEPLFEGPLHIDITFYMAIPSSVNRKRHMQLHQSPTITKPDLDNLIKMCCDLGNGILYKDDAIITSISAKKVYDINPRVEFSIKPLLESKNANKKV